MNLAQDPLSQREKAILMGLFISKFSERAYESFGFSTYKEAYNVFGYSVGYPPSSIKNYQQEFDRYFPNGRDGWKRPVRNYCKSVFDKYHTLGFEEFYLIISTLLLDDFVDINDMRSSYNKRRKQLFSANRLLTGKAAEEYFVVNYKNITPFENYTLFDTTNMGCGFDFKLSHEKQNYYIEVKGIRNREGNILLTQKEFNMAEDLTDRYCLFVVSNFCDEPVHQMFFNPIHCGNLLFDKKISHIDQTTYSSFIR